MRIPPDLLGSPPAIRIARAGDADPGSRKGGEEERVALLRKRIARCALKIPAVIQREPYENPTMDTMTYPAHPQRSIREGDHAAR
jgi:hypothetical protein